MVIAEGLPELWYGWVALIAALGILALAAVFSIQQKGAEMRGVLHRFVGRVRGTRYTLIHDYPNPDPTQRKRWIAEKKRGGGKR